jgi:hypothetical protein
VLFVNVINAFSIVIPTVAVLLGVLLNRQDATALRSEMAQLRGDVNRNIAQLRTELRSEMVQFRNTIHADMIGLHERIATVEAKQA